MSKPKIRLVCEGDMQCSNPVYLTKAEVIVYNNFRKPILCRDCYPRYKDEVREAPLPMELIFD